MLNGSKSLLKSRGVWGGAIGTLLGATQLFGYTVTAADARELADLVQGLIAALAGILAVIGRIRATKKIG